MSDCIIWTGAVQSSGYGSVTNGRGGSMLAHRKAWEDANGPIPGDLTVDHLCAEKLCQNVDHMELVTRAENNRRALAARTHCKHGHELTAENVYTQTRANGYTYRVCRQCQLGHARRYRERTSTPWSSPVEKVPSAAATA